MIGQNLDGDVAIELHIASAVHLAHSTLAEERQDFVRSESGSALECHVLLLQRADYDQRPSAAASVRRPGVPVVEMYQAAHVNARLQLNVTDICLPVVGSR
jgi:hypothetical protein